MRRYIWSVTLGLTSIGAGSGEAFAQHGRGGHGGGHPGMHRPAGPGNVPAHPSPSRPPAAHPSPRPAPAGGSIRPAPARPGAGKPSPLLANVRPSQRPGQALASANRPGTRPSTVSLAAKPSTRPAQVATKPRPGQGPKPAQGGSGLNLLDPGTNTILNGIGNKGGPQLAAALKTVQSGGLLSSADIKALQAAEKNPKLTPTQKGAIASALQADAAEKRQLAALAKAGGAVVIAGGLGGLGGLGGGLGGGTGGDGGPVVGGTPVGGGAPVETSSAPPAYVEAADPGGSGEEEAPAVATEYGVSITGLTAGGAAAEQGLLAGDIILSFAGVRTQSFEDLRDAVAGTSGQAEVIFINSQNGQTESLTVIPRSGRIGIRGQAVELK